MHEFDYIIDKINAAELLTSPYEHVWIDNFLSDEHYAQLVKNYHAQQFASRDDDHSTSANVEWQPFREFIQTSKSLYDAMQTKLTATRLWDDISKIVNIYLWDNPEHYIHLHSDALNGKETIQWHIYMPDIDYKKYGTILCKVDKDSYNENNDNCFDILESKELPLTRNSFLAYGRNANADYHYTEPGDRVRKSLLARYI